jgi:hypothetical protein
MSETGELVCDCDETYAFPIHNGQQFVACRGCGKEWPLNESRAEDVEAARFAREQKAALELGDELLRRVEERQAKVGVNPKDLIGSTKVDLALVPPAGIIACALAMTDGALKYDPYNWRESGKPVQARTYVSAAKRHLDSWLDGEEVSDDAGVHHLGHAMACCAILLDAQSCGQLVDNRPPKGETSRLLKEGSAIVKRLIDAAAAKKAAT